MINHDYLAQPEKHHINQNSLLDKKKCTFFTRLWFQLLEKLSHLKLSNLSTFLHSRDFCDKWQRNEKGQVVVHGSILN